MRDLKSDRKGPPIGTAKQVVVFLHGYGADGADLMGLADPLAPHLPDTAFYAPDAPAPCGVSPMGRQWFPIPWIDGTSEIVMKTEMRKAVADLQAFLDGVIEAEKIPANRLVLFGFSQGTMMSLEVGPRRADPLAGIVGFSGRLLEPERLNAEVRSRIPVLLLHGDMDDVVPFSSMAEAESALRGAEFEVETHVMRGTPHGIAPDGMGRALAFMHEILGLSAQ